MHKIKDKLMESLYEIEEKISKAPGTALSLQDVEKIHKITDTVKNIDKIEMLEGEGGYSEESNWMGRGQIYGTSYDGGSSYARGGRGRNAKRDSMGRYSRDGYSEEGGSSYRGGQGGNRGGYSRENYSRDGYSMDDGKEQIIDRLEDMMHEVDPKSKEAIKRCISTLENA